ncbi:unnamed protein product, partial [Coregonus sp. 'balchen']
MKLLVCCLLAVTCCVLANADKVERSLKLTEVIKDVGALKKSVEECCAVSALECFRTMVLNLTAREKKFQQKKTVCQICNSYPMKDSRKFLQQLESLLQK